MIDVAFVPDERALAEDLGADPVNADAGVLGETYFVMPVRLVVGGVDLLGTTADPRAPVMLPGETVLLGRPAGRPLPILGFAVDLLDAVRAVQPGSERTCKLAGGGELLLSRRNDTIKVASSLTGGSAEADAAEWRHAAEAFLGQVGDLLRARVPGIEARSAWKEWFNE